jgi:glutaminyl-tRNA synthetase
VEWFEAVNNPEDESMGARKVPFSRELYIEQDDFREDPPKKFFRLSPGREIRLKHAYYIKCVGVVKDPATGQVVELRCTYDPETRGGWSADGRMVKGTAHWVSAAHAVDAEVRLYDRLFRSENPDEVPEGGSWLDNLNPDSLQVLTGCKAEPGLAAAVPGESFQFLRQGYFCVDPDSGTGAVRVRASGAGTPEVSAGEDATGSKPAAVSGPGGKPSAAPSAVHQTVSLKDSWARIEKSRKEGPE